MKYKKEPRYSKSYYSKARVIAVSALLLCLVAFFTVSSVFIYKHNVMDALTNLKTENVQSLNLVSEAIETSTRIGTFFSIYKNISPVFQSQTDMDLLKATLSQEIQSFVSCFDYIKGVCVDTGNFVVKKGDLSGGEYITFQKSNMFEIRYLTDMVWPKLIQIEYQSANTDRFNVTVNLSATYLSSKNLRDNNYLISKDGTILLTVDTELSGKKLQDVSEIHLDDIFSGKTESGRYLVAVSPLEQGGAYIVSLKSSAEVRTEVFGQLVLYSFFCLMISIISVVLLNCFLKRLYQPIQSVIQTIKYLIPDDQIAVEQEADFINRCIRDRHSPLDEETEAAVIKIKNSQLKVLHSQISPHFLGNSLDVIKWESVKKLGIDNPIERSLATLTLFLAEATQYKKIISTIEEEIQRTKLYIELMKFCYAENLSVFWNVDNSVLGCSIVSLTLQPLLENSITHGFIHMQATPEIHMDISCQNDSIRIIIRDNGGGMTPDMLKSIQQSLRDDEYTQRHIGLKNTHLKLKMLYGDEYGIRSIHSCDTGTQIELVIPKYFL